MRIFKVTGAASPEKVRLVANGNGYDYTYLRPVGAGTGYGPPKQMQDYPDFITSIQPATLMAQPDFADYSMFLRGFAPGDSNRLRSLVKDVHGLANVHARTLPTKMSLVDYLHVTLSRAEIMVAVLVPFASSDPADWALALPCADPATIVTDLPMTAVATFDEVVARVMPNMAFDLASSTVTAGIVSVPVKVSLPSSQLATGCKATVYLESTGGQLLAARIQVSDDGLAHAMVDISAVPAGMPIKLKAGFKYWSGLATVNFTVTGPSAISAGA